MALSNSQYDQLMRTYEQRQLDNEYRLRMRYEKVYSLIPELEEVDHSISSLSIQKAGLLLDGDETALSTLKEEVESLSGKKEGSAGISWISIRLSGASLFLPRLQRHRIYRTPEMSLL